MSLRNNDGIDRQFKCELGLNCSVFRCMQQRLGNENATQRRGDAESAKDERIMEGVSLCILCVSAPFP